MRVQHGLFLLACSALPVALAADADDLLTALKRARILSARGQVQVTVNFPPRENPVRQAAKLPLVPVRPALLGKNFAITKGGTELVATRPTTRFELRPNNPQAARWTVWVDQTWNIPLAYEERRADGTLARQAVFQKVNAKPVPAKETVPAIPPGLRAAVQAALPGFRFPAGFTPVSVSRKEQRLDITLSDGLNTLALVLAPRNVKAAPGVASRQVGGQFVWLVGNLPQEALGAALAPVRQVNEAALGTFLTPVVSNP